MTKALTSEKLARHFNRVDQDAGSNYEDMVRVLPITHASVDCRACSGNGYKELSEQELRKFAAQIAKQETVEHRDQVRRQLSRASDCQSCRGTGKVSAPRGDRSGVMDSMWTTVRCGLCRGGGEVTTPTDTSAERQDVCLGCGGDAYIVPVTVRTKGSTNQGGGSSATDGDVAPLLLASATDSSAEHDQNDEEHQRAARTLEDLKTRDPQLASALASYHGPEGNGWVEHRWGRAFVLWQHTTAGQQLAAHVAAHSPRRAGYLVAATDRLAQAREAQERQPVGRPAPDAALTRVLLARADREARELLRRVRATASEVETAA